MNGIIIFNRKCKQNRHLQCPGLWFGLGFQWYCECKCHQEKNQAIDKVLEPASIAIISEDSKEIDQRSRDKGKDFESTSDNEKDKNSESQATDAAENNSLKKLRKRQKESLEIVQVPTERKFRKLTDDQEDFLNRIGRYAPYRPVRTEVEEED